MTKIESAYKQWTNDELAYAMFDFVVGITCGVLLVAIIYCVTSWVV